MSSTRKHVKRLKRAKLVKKVTKMWRSNVSKRFSFNKPAPTSVLDAVKKKFL